MTAVDRQTGARFAQVVLALAPTLVLGSCASAPARPSVVLVILDTLRADHMSLYGYERDTTPRFDELAARGAVFERAFSAAAWTLPGVGSILSGQWPAVHGAGIGGGDGSTRPRESVPLLAEIFAAAGYRTAAIANGGYLNEPFGLNRGFAEYDYASGTDDSIRRADVSVDLTLDWIDRRDGQQPFFFMLHLFDVHRHYDAPEPARGTFTDQFADRYGDAMASIESRWLAEERGDVEFHVAAYDEEILWVDSQVARLFEGLEARGLREDVVVAITADHGEAFFEHGAKAHGSSLFNEVMRVPLLLFGPGVTAGRFHEPVSTVDIAPTLLALAGVPAPPAGGVSLLPVMAGQPLPPRLLYAQNDIYASDLTAVIDWPYKLIQDFRNATSWMYDLEADPLEQNDLAAGATGATARKMRDLRRTARELREATIGDSAVTLDAETLKELRALGYIQ